MERSGKRNSGTPSNKTQIKRSFQDAEISQSVRSDDTTQAEKRGECFCSSSAERVLDKRPGFDKVRPTSENPNTNKGWDTLSSDSRNAPLAGSESKIELHQKRNDENIIYDGATTTVTEGATKARK